MKTFRSELLRIIDASIGNGVRFVVHPLNSTETDTLIDILNEKSIFPIPPGLTNEKLRENAESEWGDDACYEINLRGMFTSINNVEHWKQYTKDIIEWDDEKQHFNFVEGCE